MRDREESDSILKVVSRGFELPMRDRETQTVYHRNGAVRSFELPMRDRESVNRGGSVPPVAGSNSP